MLRLAPFVIGDVVRAALGRSPGYVPLIAERGNVAVVSDDAAADQALRLLEASGMQRGDVEETLAARIVLWISFYSPIRYASAIRCPALVQVADGDTIAPADAAATAASRMRRVTLIRYDADHFEPYTSPHFDAFIADQLDFLRRTVPLVQPADVTAT
jgi:pimeloyl-ACP methyl ester carboxylesterase